MVSFMIHNICIWYPWYIILMSGIHDCFAGNTSLSNYWRNWNIGSLVKITSKHPTTRLCPNPSPTWLNSLPYLIKIDEKLLTPMRLQTDTRTKLYIYIDIIILTLIWLNNIAALAFTRSNCGFSKFVILSQILQGKLKRYLTEINFTIWTFCIVSN